MVSAAAMAAMAGLARKTPNPQPAAADSAARVAAFLRAAQLPAIAPLPGSVRRP
jgi:hypothetical protein